MSKKKLPFTPKKDPMNLKPNIKRIILNEQEFPYDFDKNTVTINDQIFTGNNSYKKTTIKRKDVKPLLNSMKKEASSFKKVGGVVKTKKK